MSKELTPWKINRMRKPDLLKLAAQYPDIEIPRTGAVCQQLKKVLAEKIKAGESPAEPTPAPVQVGDPALFDELTSPAGDDDHAQQPEPEQPAGSGRGGSRPGAGRKPGVTLEQSRIDHLPTEPNRTVIYVIKWVFRLWATVADCKEIALDDDELREFATDTTQFLEYHGIRIPQGLAVDGKFILGGCELIGSRVMMHKVHKQKIKAQKEKQNEGHE